MRVTLTTTDYSIPSSQWQWSWVTCFGQDTLWRTRSRYKQGRLVSCHRDLRHSIVRSLPWTCLSGILQPRTFPSSSPSSIFPGPLGLADLQKPLASSVTSGLTCW